MTLLIRLLWRHYFLFYEVTKTYMTLLPLYYDVHYDVTNSSSMASLTPLLTLSYDTINLL